MAKTTSIYARVEPEIKEQAEKVLSQLGIPVSSAISMFLRQVVIKRGIPFDVTLPENMPVNLSSLTDEEFDAEIEKGMNDIISGRVLSAKTVMDNMRREYGMRVIKLSIQKLHTMKFGQTINTLLLICMNQKQQQAV